MSSTTTNASAGVRNVQAILEGLFESGRAADLIRAYYRVTENGTRKFTGAAFDRIASNPDPQPNSFTDSDLLGLSLLSVPVGVEIVRDLRSGTFDEEVPGFGLSLNELLAKVPTDVRFEECLDDGRFALYLAPGSAADTLWKATRHMSTQQSWGFGDTRISKLLATKRPLLVPIFDSVVGAAFGYGHAGEHWNDVRALMQLEGVQEGLRNSKFSSGAEVSLIRALDIILWMELKGNYAQRADGTLY